MGRRGDRVASLREKKGRLENEFADEYGASSRRRSKSRSRKDGDGEGRSSRKSSRQSRRKSRTGEEEGLRSGRRSSSRGRREDSYGSISDDSPGRGKSPSRRRSAQAYGKRIDLDEFLGEKRSSRSSRRDSARKSQRQRSSSRSAYEMYDGRESSKRDKGRRSKKTSRRGRRSRKPRRARALPRLLVLGACAVAGFMAMNDDDFLTKFGLGRGGGGASTIVGGDATSAVPGGGWTAGRENIGQPGSQPNIIMFFPDDMGYNDVGFTNPYVFKPFETPNIDALAQKGVHLSSYYTGPVCSPARCALMTGRYLHRTGCHGGDIDNKNAWGVPLTETFIPEYLADAGYYNVAFGKWHLGMSAYDFLPTRRGFNKFIGFIGEGEDHFSHENDDAYDWYEDEVIDESYENIFSTYALNTSIQNFLYNDAYALQPWFMYVPAQVPHGPYDAPDVWIDKVDDLGVLDDDDLDGDAGNWAAMVMMLDDMVGATVVALKETNMYADTIVIYAGDHGTPQDEPDYDGSVGRDYPFSGGKGELWEGGVRTPCFVHNPNLSEEWVGQKFDAVTSVYDWLPTFASWAGADTSYGNQLDGRDLGQYLFQGYQADYSREVVIMIDNGCEDDEDWDDPNAAIRVGNYKLLVGCVTTNGYFYGDEELFNVVDDVGEEYNLLDDNDFVTNYAGLIEYMEDALSDYALEAVEPFYAWCDDCDLNSGDRDGDVEPWLEYPDGYAL